MLLGRWKRGELITWFGHGQMRNAYKMLPGDKILKDFKARRVEVLKVLQTVYV
jgi:hypothetical protein